MLVLAFGIWDLGFGFDQLMPPPISLVGAGPGDPELWTVRAMRRVQEADLVLYDALVDAAALRRLTSAQCFCVGKRAGRASVKQETVTALMIRAARQGKRVVRLKGGDPFVFGRGAEEALALAMAGVAYEVVPGVTTAVAAPELAGIPVTHRGVASAFLVLAGHAGDPLDRTLAGVLPGSVTLVVMMGLGSRGAIAAQLMARGWAPDSRAGIVCSASMPGQWTWTGRLDEVARVVPPAGAPGVLIVGDVIQVGEALVRAGSPPGIATDEVKYGRNG
jgi:uroporphyrin-III C-methyltransferase/precorrin-2 dehydrogenase/sirohydrochlorin ferrochelatase